ncbi:hypothetical protein FRC08_017739 [Ceratobasidium sp. 394]|nr:hypothetical protein FRC08_017739 [Ceratobasidium sp. 394]
MATATEPTTKRTPEDVRFLVTPAGSLDSHRCALRALASGSRAPPLWMAGKSPKEQRQTVSACLDAAITEISRQFNVNVYGCAVWKDEDETLATTQVVQLIDQDYGLSNKMIRARQHFSDYVCRSVGIALVVKTEEAYPVPFPDLSMDARPALPPEHPNWEQERDNISEWFMFLHMWQGGNDGPNWYLIQTDLNTQKYKMIEKVRLPVAHIPFVVPDDWNENITRTWSKHLWSCTDDFGLIDEDEKPYRVDLEFRDECFNTSGLEYGMPALMYAERVERERQAMSASASNCVAQLYPEAASRYIDQAVQYVPSMAVLWSALRGYEARNPPQAPVPSSAGLAAWPRPAKQVNRDITSIQDNYDNHDYPDEFLDLEHEHWGSWNTSKLHTWILSNPFLDESSSLQMGGPHGICVGFISVLQFTLNYARVTPRTPAAERSLLSQGRAVYGPRELYFLRRSADKLLDFVKSSGVLLPALRLKYDTDVALRRQSWRPQGWSNISFDGTTTELPASELDLGNHPSSNVFDDTTEEHWDTVTGFNTTATTDITSSSFDVTRGQSTMNSSFDMNRVLGRDSSAGPVSNAPQTFQRTHSKVQQPEPKQYSGSRTLLPPELVQPAAVTVQDNQARGPEGITSARVTSVSLPVQAPSWRSQSVPGIDRNVQPDHPSTQGNVLGLSNLSAKAVIPGSSSATDSGLARPSPNHRNPASVAGPKYQLRVEIPTQARKRSPNTGATTTPGSSDQRAVNLPKGVAGASGSATKASTPTKVRRDTPVGVKHH